MDSQTEDLTSKRLGGKGASLKILREATLVPPFEIVNTAIFDAFLHTYEIEEVFMRYWQAVVQRASEEILDHVRASLIPAFLLLPLPDFIEDTLLSIFDRVPGEMRVARSSASVEDGSLRSWAGQFCTIFGIRTPSDWMQAIRTCWASVVTPEVASYGRAAGENCPAPRIAVILQQAIDAVIAGVVFSTDPTGQTSGPLVEATWGLGSPLVSGIVTPERWISCQDGTMQRSRYWSGGSVWLLGNARDPAPGSSQWLFMSNGSKIELRALGSSMIDGIWAGSPIVSATHRPCILSPKQATQIAQFACERASTAGIPRELEWLIDSDGCLWWLQERTITVIHNTAHLEPREVGSAPLATGVIGSCGLSCGPGWWIGEAKPDVREDLRPILFKTTTTPADVPLLMGVGGLVTQDGGVLSHSAIVCRELEIPCIIGAHPFPPYINVSGTLMLDANVGEVRRIDEATTVQTLQLPSIVVLNSPSQLCTDTDIRMWMDKDLGSRIPPHLSHTLQRVATMPGVLGSIDVLPDLKEPHQHLGFPIGVVFHSDRFHPTAVSDCGDGFRLCMIEDMELQHIVEHTEHIVTSLRHWLGAESPVSEQVRADVSLLRTFSEGVEALTGTRWQEIHPERIENGGVIRGGDASSLDRDLLTLAQQCMAWHGEAGHFLEILALSTDPDSYTLDPHRPVAVFFHTGSIELGLEFLQRAVERGFAAAQREGIDDPDSLVEGLWGVDITGYAGRALLAAAIGIVNYSFARRCILQHLVERALSEALGHSCRLQLVSDILHTGVRPVGDGLLHQQGVQALRPVDAPVPLIVAGAPGVASYLIIPNPNTPGDWCCHGKVNFGYRKDLLRPDIAEQVSHQTLVAGPWNEDVVISDTQTREAVQMINGLGLAQISQVSLPIVCFRGHRNGLPKILRKRR